mmetsp:Transcript_6144/g.19337  ORF Transcript_6144/g.19337 Transcript_6144/m.19337 type:complete len:208 (-) Transcript_6144:314-937(-)
MGRCRDNQLRRASPAGGRSLIEEEGRILYGCGRHGRCRPTEEGRGIPCRRRGLSRSSTGGGRSNLLASCPAELRAGGRTGCHGKAGIPGGAGGDPRLWHQSGGAARPKEAGSVGGAAQPRDRFGSWSGKQRRGIATLTLRRDSQSTRVRRAAIRLPSSRVRGHLGAGAEEGIHGARDSRRSREAPGQSLGDAPPRLARPLRHGAVQP